MLIVKHPVTRVQCLPCLCILLACRYTYLLDLAIQHRQPLLMVGPSGTGKTCIIAAHLLSGKGLAQELWMPVAITLSARTTANMLQEQVGRCIFPMDSTLLFGTTSVVCLHLYDSRKRSMSINV